MNCYDCKAKSVCAAVVQPGSVICLMNRMRYCGTHAEEEPRRQQGDYCQYCGFCDWTLAPSHSLL